MERLPETVLSADNLYENDGYFEGDEVSVVDDRAGLRPTDEVQLKLLRAMPAAVVPVSCLHTHRDTRRSAN
jgi:hypothetical protein